jgi:predicted DNA-binding transcriptional regulator YafY
MSQGVDIEILSPKALRKGIAESLKEAYEQYVTDS